MSLVARDAERLATAADELEAEVGDPTRVATEPADVTDAESVARALDLLMAQFGPVEVLVANAGGARPGRFEELTVDVFRDQMELNYFGALHPVRAVVPSMIERGRGHLVLVVVGGSDRRRVRILRLRAGQVRASVAWPRRCGRSSSRTGSSSRAPIRPTPTRPAWRSENATKPAATASISATVKVRSADRRGAVDRARHRARPARDHGRSRRRRCWPAPAGLLGPIVRGVTDRQVRRAGDSWTARGYRQGCGEASFDPHARATAWGRSRCLPTATGVRRPSARCITSRSATTGCRSRSSAAWRSSRRPRRSRTASSASSRRTRPT